MTEPKPPKEPTHDHAAARALIWTLIPMCVLGLGVLVVSVRPTQEGTEASPKVEPTPRMVHPPATTYPPAFYTIWGNVMQGKEVMPNAPPSKYSGGPQHHKPTPAVRAAGAHHHWHYAAPDESAETQRLNRLYGVQYGVQTGSQ